MKTCPSETILRLIGTESVGEATFEGLEAHVEQCPECQHILESATKAVPLANYPAPAWSIPPTVPGLVIERELGRGGMGVVYLAWEPALKRHVAVKLIPRNSLVDPHSREHWLAEARALSRVPHDHVVAIHRVEETEEWLCLVIEFVSGGTLKERMTEPLPPRDAARLTETIARAVGYFHGRGLSHLDLKPSNILLDGESGSPWESVSPRISDFGIARLEGEPGTTETGANGPKGTPSYMAPEQVAALPGTIGPAADIYALGALLYHLLTGRPPFQGASSAETLDQVRNQDPAPPRRINGRIPRDLETICLRCLEKAPNRRYRTAETLAVDLRLWLEGRPIVARRVSPIGHAWRFCSRHPAVAGLLMALATTLVTGVVGLLVLLDQARAERMRLAEARRHAEAYEQFSASAAGELGRLLRTTIREYRSPAPDQMAASLLSLRNSTRDLRNRGIAPSSNLGILELEIGWALLSSGKRGEARDVLKQAVADLKHSLAKNPEDEEVRHSLCYALLWSGELAEAAGQLEHALECFEQSAAIRMTASPVEKDYVYYTFLYKKLSSISDRLGRDGRTGPGGRAREFSQQILRQLLGIEVSSSTVASLPDVEILSSLVQLSAFKAMSTQENMALRHEHENVVAEWLARSVHAHSPFRSPSVAAEFERDQEARATALIAAVRARCSKLGLADSMVPAALNVVCDDAFEAGSLQRRLGQYAEARATAAIFMTIARRLVQEYPDSSQSYRLLSQAYDQIKKNAYKSEDEKLVEEALVQAVVAAQRALDLDPERLETRRHLDKLSEQLASIRAERNAMGSSHP